MEIGAEIWENSRGRPLGPLVPAVTFHPGHLLSVGCLLKKKEKRSFYRTRFCTVEWLQKCP